MVGACGLYSAVAQAFGRRAALATASTAMAINLLMFISRGLHFERSLPSEAVYGWIVGACGLCSAVADGFVGRAALGTVDTAMSIDLLMFMSRGLHLQSPHGWDPRMRLPFLPILC
jgi:hypothetical protein